MTASCRCFGILAISLPTSARSARVGAKLVHNMRWLLHSDCARGSVHDGRQGGRGSAGALGGRAPVLAGRASVVRPSGQAISAGAFDPPDFALKLAHKDVMLATELAREIGVPMRLAKLTRAEMTEALNRGWGERDSRVPCCCRKSAPAWTSRCPWRTSKRCSSRTGHSQGTCREQRGYFERLGSWKLVVISKHLLL